MKLSDPDIWLQWLVGIGLILLVVLISAVSTVIAGSPITGNPIIDQAVSK